MPTQSTNIVLIGFMGSGKTSISKELAHKLGWTRVSIDETIEEAEGCRISELFKTKGEEYFRQKETEVIKKLLMCYNSIIDCGGGVVINSENILHLKQIGKVFFINTRLEVIYNRLKNDKIRPLLQVAHPQQAIEELLNKRLPLYRQASDVEVQCNDLTVDAAVDEILKNI